MNTAVEKASSDEGFRQQWSTLPKAFRFLANSVEAAVRAWKRSIRLTLVPVNEGPAVDEVAAVMSRGYSLSTDAAPGLQV